MPTVDQGQRFVPSLRHRTTSGVFRKKCLGCDEWPPTDQYDDDSGTQDGKSSLCRTCQGGGQKKSVGKKRGPSKRRIQHQIIDGIEKKLCGRCKEWKALDQFHSNKSMWDGLRNQCKACSSAWDKEKREQTNDAKTAEGMKMPAHKTTHRTINGQEMKQCSECLAWQPLDQFYKGNSSWDNLDGICKDCRKDKWARTEAAETGLPVGVLLDDYIDYYFRQGGRCAICGDRLGKDVSVVYHDQGHLLCWPCHRLLRMAHRDIDLLQGAATYIELCETPLCYA